MSCLYKPFTAIIRKRKYNNILSEAQLDFLPGCSFNFA